MLATVDYWGLLRVNRDDENAGVSNKLHGADANMLPVMRLVTKYLEYLGKNGLINLALECPEVVVAIATVARVVLVLNLCTRQSVSHFKYHNLQWA